MPVDDPTPPVIIPTPAPGLGYGGREYSYSPYGHGKFPRPPVPSDGGYGGAPYGTSPYGSTEITPPRVTGLNSIDGFTFEVFFSEEMLVDEAFCDPDNYVITALLGAPATATAVAEGVAGTQGGATSAIITHSGTTLGGQYQMTVLNATDLAGNPVDALPTNTATALAFGDTPIYTVTPTSGSTVDVQFLRSDASQTQSMVPETTFSPGIEEVAAYGITTTYPIDLTVDSVTFPGTGGDDSIVTLDVGAMTSAVYSTEIAPSVSIDYDGSILPSASPDFTGSETGTGSSTAGVSGLLLTKSSGVSYGWNFFDTSGRLLPSSTYRVDIDIDVSAATTISPTLTNVTFATMTVADGAVGISATLTRMSGVDMIQIDSGALSQAFLAEWSAGPVKLTLLRNQLAGHISFLLNETPLFTAAVASFTGVPAHAPGTRFTLAPTYAVVDFPLNAVRFTSTQTIFSSSWNFLHSVTNTFTGSAANAREFILTERGPLVKGWGDATPATKQDVTVTVNSTPVDISDVNPYVGKIFPAIPIPLGATGANTIEVDYKWFPAPIMAMAGLNTEGLILNKWDQPNGHTEPGVSPTPSTSLGAVDTARFPMGVALNAVQRTSPVRVGHRYIGYERAYTASLNSPTTLLLNQSNHQTSRNNFQKAPSPVVVSYEANTDPTTAPAAWTLSGADTGSQNEGESTYTLIDASAGSFGSGDAAFYYRDESLACPSTVSISTRLVVDSYTSDGVFTGLGFGFHDNYRLYLAGFLVVNELKHVGVLLDPSKPHLLASWQIGPSVTATIVDSLTFTVPTSEFPTVLDEGASFQILEGSQTGIYKIALCGVVQGSDGVTTVTLDSTTPFPADPALFGNDTSEIIFETPWDSDLTTYRLVTDPGTRTTQFYVGGSLSGVVAEVVGVPSLPAYTSLKLNPTEEGFGRVFWGSVSRIAVNQSTWTFNRYSITPDQASFNAEGIVVSAEMSDLPTADPNNEWYLVNEFGIGKIDSSGDTLLLKSTSGSDSTKETFGYGRVEPFLTATSIIDVDATFRVESGVRGSGDALIQVRDGTRLIEFTNLMYTEDGGSRSLLSLESVSLSGLLVPTEDGWTESSTFSLSASIRQNLLTTTQAVGDEGLWNSPALATTGDRRVIEARFAVASYTAGSGGDLGVIFGASPVTTTSRRPVLLTLRTSDTIVLRDGNQNEITTFSFAWDDGQPHDYRIFVDTVLDTVTLTVDDTLIGTTTWTSFPVVTGTESMVFGAFGTDRATTVEWDSLAFSEVPDTTVKKTIGVYLGGDASDIDNWEIPRTDALAVENSNLTAVVEEMDWTSDIQVRIRKDPGWGVTVYRPDLPFPPYYDANGQATEVTNPSEGWINVEYPRLPRKSDAFGQVQFGALSPESVTQQRWSDVRYRIYSEPTENLLAPQGMVLNRFNVITSGELNTDTTPEVVTVPTLTSTLVSLRPAHINADRVFNVLIDGTAYGPSSFTFDKATQAIFLTTPVDVGVDAQVTFAPGKPVTNTYLAAQPVLDSITLLNEGTPPIPKGQTTDAVREEVFGGRINDPNDTLNDDPDFILNDPFRSIQFTDLEGSLYDCMEFQEIDDGGATGVLSIACDGPAPESGLIELALEGDAYKDAFSVPGGVGGPWGNSSPSIAGTASSFDTTSVLHFNAGGVLGGGGLGGGRPFVMYPNQFSGTMEAGSDAIQPQNRETQMVLALSPSPTNTAYTEDLSTISDDDEAPSGATSTHGTGIADYEIADYTDANSVIGPWGGLSSLEARSLLGGGGLPPSGTALTLNQSLTTPTITTGTAEAANP